METPLHALLRITAGLTLNDGALLLDIGGVRVLK
jgi:hypothetical protein